LRSIERFRTPDTVQHEKVSATRELNREVEGVEIRLRVVEATELPLGEESLLPGCMHTLLLSGGS
jgi:hypothetical protein